MNKVTILNPPKELRGPDGTLTVSAEPGENLFRLLRRAGAAPESYCGGTGRCGKCTVRVDGREVLACETTVDRDLTVELPLPESYTESAMTLCGGYQRPAAEGPAAERFSQVARQRTDVCALGASYPDVGRRKSERRYIFNVDAWIHPTLRFRDALGVRPLRIEGFQLHLADVDVLPGQQLGIAVVESAVPALGGLPGFARHFVGPHSIHRFGAEERSDLLLLSQEFRKHF